MGPDLKKRLWSLSLIAGGALILTSVVIFMATYHPSEVSDAVKRAVGISALGGAISFIFGLALLAALKVDLKEVSLAWRWFRLIGGEFPRDKQERNASRERAYDILKIFAASASDLFTQREEVREIFAKADTTPFPPATTGKELKRARRIHKESIARLMRDHLRLDAMAEKTHRQYIERWKLFEDMGMIPFKPGTEEPWSDPNDFRQLACATLITGIMQARQAKAEATAKLTIAHVTE
jgi:hypothetical protein